MRMNIEPTFINPDYVEKIINMMFGFPKSYPLPDNHSFLSRINHMSSQDKSRVYNKKNCLTMLCFLPCEFNNIPIDTLSIAFKNMLETTGISGRFEVVILNDVDSKNQLQTIEDGRNRAIESRKEGVIVLSGKKCSMGISIKHCDIVFLLNGLKAYDMLFQMMFRSLTEDDGKKNGYVVDLHIQRSIDVLMEYALSIKPAEDPKNTLLYMMENKIILLNADEWMPTYLKVFDKTVPMNNLISDVYKIWESDPLRNIPTLLRHMKKEFGTMDVSSQLQKSFNNIFLDNTYKIKNSKETVYDTDDVDISKGVEKKTKKIRRGEDEDDIIVEVIVEVEKDVDIYEIMIKIIPVLCILTIQNSSNGFREMLAHIYRNPELHLILDECIKFLSKNKTDISKCILYIIKMYENNLEDNVIVNQTIRKIKDMFILNKKDNRKLSELIDLYLVPSDNEKKKNAEVSTPIALRQEMLNTIPLDFWTTPKKILEPCAGKGGFLMDIVDKFMEGLKEVIIDKEERYKYIVEECLYWCDINKLNVFICKMLLDPDGIYNLKYNEGDTLTTDLYGKWGYKFDLVVGNPPYQDTGENDRKALNHNLWSSFILKVFPLIVENGFLLFITPTSWMSPANKISIFYEKYILYLNVNDCKKYFNVGSQFCYYLIQNTIVKRMTTVICKYKNDVYNSSLLIDNITFLPMLLTNISMSIINKFYNNNFNKVSFKRNTSYHSSTKKSIFSRNKTDINCFEFKHTIKSSLWSTIKHPLQDSKKILLNLSGNLNPVYDDGLFGFTEAQMYLLTDNENYVNTLNSNLYSFVFNICKWSGFNIEKTYHNIPFIGFISNEDMYNRFLLTTEEILIINKYSTQSIEELKNHSTLNQLKKSLQDLKISELKNIARTEGIKGYSKYTTKTKNELIEKIEKHRADNL